MQSSDFEKFVEAYLLNTRAIFVQPQFLVHLNKRERWIDILAADLANRKFFLVEVTENRNPRHLVEKILDFHDHADWLAKRLVQEFNLQQDWVTKPWLFIRSDAKDMFRAALGSVKLTENTDYDLTELESIIARSAPGTQKLAEHWGPLAKTENLLKRDHRVTALTRRPGDDK
jgi:hypothetical protein